MFYKSSLSYPFTSSAMRLYNNCNAYNVGSGIMFCILKKLTSNITKDKLLIEMHTVCCKKGIVNVIWCDMIIRQLSTRD